MKNMKDAIEAIKETADKEGIVVYNPMNLKVNKYDRIALELIEQLQDYSFGEAIEILQTAIFWLVLLNSIKAADNEIDENKIKSGVVLTKEEKEEKRRDEILDEKLERRRY